MAGSIPFLTLGLSESDIRRLREHPSDSQTVRRLGDLFLQSRSVTSQHLS
ncbi:hypothetical protein J007_05945 [Cryptococcus neoformans]|nr:hypothetical protein C356_06041 [Cryptococcus neoformans var. grubii c45]OXB34368.1 hypothetical protein J007_05945 [Cryptococcus neoformans var. grubii]OXC58514.1 hypothetical protein C358_06037 [Cryptococcus neoformans var. grubii MW-RSA852]